MGDSWGTSESGVAVRRLRVAYIATRIHDRVLEIGQPEAFAQRLVTRAPLLGLGVGLPFGADLPVDTRFWSTLAEVNTSREMTIDLARRLRRAAVPLRHRAPFSTAGAEAPRLEAHLHPFGIVTIATVDFLWSDPVPLAEAWKSVRDAEQSSAIVTIGQTPISAQLGEAAAAAADTLLNLIADRGGTAWIVDDYRVATVIDGQVGVGPGVMPAAGGDLHSSLHRLSRGGTVLPEPVRAFVAQWSGADFAWAPTRLIYMLDAGTSLLVADEGAAPSTSNRSARHRRLTLLLTHLTASVGLVRARRDIVRATSDRSSSYFAEWGRLAADRLGRYYGPAPANDEWGLETRTYLTSIGAVADVEDVRGSPLIARYTTPAYP